jgi:hypothetical protein
VLVLVGVAVAFVVGVFNSWLTAFFPFIFRFQEVKHHESVDRKIAERKTITLDDCIKLFLNREKLSADDPW